MNFGIYRVACATNDTVVANCSHNASSVIELITKAKENNAAFLLLPELAISAYTCSDLFLQETLLQNAQTELFNIAKYTDGICCVVGLPLKASGMLFNCAAVLSNGSILGIVPKTYIPNYAEFYEMRHFSGAVSSIKTIEIFNSQNGSCASVPFGTDLLFTSSKNADFVLGIEICEDLWSVTPPSVQAALAGATVIANSSASNEIIGKAGYRRMLVQSHSARLLSAYLYADAGTGESTTDLVFAAHNLIAENGTILAEAAPFEKTDGFIIADIDCQALLHERQRTTTFAQCYKNAEKSENLCYRKIELNVRPLDTQNNKLLRHIPQLPFIPQDKTNRAERCRQVIELQTAGLAKRLKHTRAKSAVIGLSGGLDSTLALLVTVNAFKKLKLDLAGICAVTMPCFGTTQRTYNNAVELAKSLNVTLKEINIKAAVLQHFADIGHDENVHDVTYENCQARERTQVLMDIANQTGGLVIGTGDLSELALGWATYNGDHMSMYGVNVSIPKTLVKHLVSWFADDFAAANMQKASETLIDILDTPVSPELLPPKDGEIAQKTEDIVGPYELHDFYLYYLLRWGFTPKKIFALAKQAFEGVYDTTTIEKWLKTFCRRFFAQQFKRSCLPDGAKVGTVSLSPRGDWRMPSDADSAQWLAQLE